MKLSNQPITLTINYSSDGLGNDGTANSTLVTLEDYSIKEAAALGNDIEVEIKLKMYKEMKLEVLPVQEKASASKAGSSKKTTKKSEPKRTTKKQTEETTYTVQSGDTLWAIAKRFYGEGDKYIYLANLNGISNPSTIRVGQVLKIGTTDAAKADKSTTVKNKSKAAPTVTKQTTKKVGEKSFAVKVLGVDDAAGMSKVAKNNTTIANRNIGYIKAYDNVQSQI